jgi:hypothetical protein
VIAACVCPLGSIPRAGLLTRLATSLINHVFGTPGRPLLNGDTLRILIGGSFRLVILPAERYQSIAFVNP